MTDQRLRDFKMPDVGEGLHEAEILKWYVKPGDAVHDGMLVCEVETAKAVVELPVPYDGLVRDLPFGEGVTVPVGAVIITVDTAPADSPAAPVSPSSPASPDAGPGAVAVATPNEAQPSVLVGYGVMNGSAVRRPRKPAAAVLGGLVRSDVAQPLAKPPVRRLARELGVDLDQVVPSGAGGTITREDVHSASRSAPERRAPDAPSSGRVDAPAEGDRRLPVKGVRRATAEAMVASAFTAPHVTEFLDVDVTRTMKLVRRLREDPDFAGVRVTPLLLIAKALITAVRRFPEINAQWVEESQEIVVRRAVNLGVAAATPRGLLVPNIKDAGSRTLPELARSLEELTRTARAGRTGPAELAGGTITVTNIGVFGVDSGTPILNRGEAAILAVGAVRERPWVHRGEVRPRQVMTLALSFDHRLVDGELGSRVLATTAAVLEDPKRLIVWG